MFFKYDFKLLKQVMQNNFTYKHQQSILVKYQKRLSRLHKALCEGRFSRYTAAKKRQLFQCLARYERQLRHWGIATGVAMLLPALPLQAQTPVPVGGEFRVNTYTTGAQNQPAIAMDSEGDFVVVWHTNFQDGWGYGIYAQRYDNTGMPQGAEFKVNTFTNYTQKQPAVAMDSDGDFVVAWYGHAPNLSYYDIYAQRYDKTGIPQGAEFVVNTFTTNVQQNPAIAMDSDGDFVVTWVSNEQDGSNYGIFAQRYDNTGMPQGATFMVNTHTTNTQSRPAIAMDSAGDFVVTWSSNFQDGSYYGIYAQRYDAAGTPQGAEFRVNTYTTSFQILPAIAMDNNGNFIVTWNSTGPGGEGNDIYAQRYYAAGTPQGAEFRVNAYSTSIQNFSAVGMDSDGDFVVTWVSYGQDGQLYGIYGQRYDNAGSPQGAEFKVNTFTSISQLNPVIAMESAGDFVVAWESQNQDGSNYGIYAQRYILPPLFPIELLFFTGHSEPDANIIEWATATEKNSAWQIVERSANGEDDWSEIGRMAGAGNSTAPLAYKISDENPLPLGYYRLTSVDFDGSLQHSEVISISRTSAELSVLNVFPVPADKEVNLVVNMPSSGFVEMSVHNTLGQLVIWQKNLLVKGSNDLKIDLLGLPSGNYTVTIADGAFRVVQQVVKM
jgi:hypothetical protein